MSRRALTVDWAMAKALYLQGVKPKEIASKLNVPGTTLSRRIQRGGWLDLRQQTADALQTEVLRTAMADSQSVSTRLREWYTTDTERLLAHIAKIPLDGMEWHEIEKRQGIIKVTYGMMSELFGWSGEESAKNSINSQLLGRLLDEVESIREKRTTATVECAPAPPAGEGSEPTMVIDSPVAQPGNPETISPPPSPAEGESENGENTI